METVDLKLGKENNLYAMAMVLAIFTIVYNLLEGLISIYFGYQDETLTLFGFGVDSFVEMISGVGIAHMIWRIRKNPGSNRDVFERTALQITGYCFYVLVIGLIISAAIIFYTGQKPETTFWGIIISLISILVMLGLMYGKINVGSQLNSGPILADASCTKVCIYMSLIVLISSVVYEMTHLPYVDALGTLSLAWFSYKEGKECFEKVMSNKQCGCEHH